MAENTEGAAATVEKSETINNVMEQVGNMSVLELSDLVKALEDKFGVSAQAPVAAAMPAGGDAAAAGEAKEEKTEFDVVLTAAGDKKIQVIKAVREITGLGLKESKGLVDGAPKAVKSGVPQSEADTMKAKLEEAGATVEIK